MIGRLSDCFVLERIEYMAFSGLISRKLIFLTDTLYLLLWISLLVIFEMELKRYLRRPIIHIFDVFIFPESVNQLAIISTNYKPHNVCTR